MAHRSVCLLGDFIIVVMKFWEIESFDYYEYYQSTAYSINCRLLACTIHSSPLRITGLLKNVRIEFGYGFRAANDRG